MANFFERLKQGLSKTREYKLADLFKTDGKLDDEFYDEIEQALILSDMGIKTVEDVLSALRSSVKSEKLKTQDDAKSALTNIIADIMRPETEFLFGHDRAVLLITGINGVGKTTSTGKLASMFKAQGHKPMLAAADTARAAAAEQLSIWAQRAAVPMVKHGEGAQPAAVVFDAIASYKAKGCDILIVDTAGRLHNKKNLMNELAGIKRVIGRELPDTHCESLMVLDATTGQNAIAQAKAFIEYADLSGVILTKLDGTAKGGVAVAIKAELGLPIRFVGVGEGIEDLQPFDADEYARALFQ